MERWEEKTEELYKKDPNHLNNHDGVVPHLESDIVECEVKWALGSNTMNTMKTSRGDEISAKLFKILNNDAIKVLHSVCQQIWKTQQWPQHWKRSVFNPIPKGSLKKQVSSRKTSIYFSLIMPRPLTVWIIIKCRKF